jgi:streptogramin lyase
MLMAILLLTGLGACGNAAAESGSTEEPKYLDVTLDVSVPLEGAGCEGIAVGPEFIYVVDGTTRVFKLTRDGTIVETMDVDSPGSRFRGIDIGPDGTLILIDSELCKIVTIDLAGNVSDVIQLPLSKGYRAISYCDGYYVSDRTTADLIKFSDAGEALSRFPIDVADVQGIDVYDSNHVWYMDDDAKLLKRKDLQSGQVSDAIDLTKVSPFKDPEGLDYDEKAGVVYMCYDGDKHIIGLYVGGKRPPKSSADTRDN